MKTYPIEEVHSGEDGCLWVSLGFVSESDPLDVLHIVCAYEVEPQDREHGMDAIYLERDDQSRGGYGGAQRILVDERAVEVRLNEAGRALLEFEDSLCLLWPAELAGKAEALRILGRMRECESGRAIELA
ncbi:hypothetical protein ASE35_10870 [Lysobacter sp. Root916]|uniref:Imm10 family immunity protein n=1 Tax=Lysobacter sp. Root916 TaxID=1736606 RepID=UPI00070C6080|nr:Imm10 family immunity protein [Lysobacter sp. Root916]KRD34220.1 hypothetical protein ASE35_10870 [Lysobacter sp. Root916]